MSSIDPLDTPLKKNTEEDTMHPLLAGDLARQRIDVCEQRAERRQLTTNRPHGPGAAVRMAVGSRLIGVGCRLFLSGHRERGALPSEWRLPSG
jgi:hypothetical protein